MADSGFSRVISVLTSPAQTFRAIAERPSFLVPLVLSALLGAVVVNITFAKVDPDDFTRQMQERMEERGQQMPSGGPSGDTMMTMARWAGTAGALFIGPITVVVVALLFWMVMMINYPSWKYVPLGVACHFALLCATRTNVHAVAMLLHHLLYPRVLWASGRSSPTKRKNWRFKLRWLRGS